MNWLSRIFFRRRRYNDLSVSIHEHLQEHMDELMHDDMPAEKAEQAAKRAFGNSTLIEERSREVWQWEFIESIWADARYAMRQMRKSPIFTATCLLTLALGIGANSAVFSIIDAILFHPLPYKQPNALVLVSESIPKLGSESVGMSPAEYVDYKNWNHSFAETAAFTNYQESFTLTGSGRPVRVSAAQMSASALPLLGVVPILGRNFTADEDRYGNERVVLLSHDLWQTQFGSSPQILNKTIYLSKEPYRIVGVMPASFRFPFDDVPRSESPKVWLPMAFNPSVMTPNNRVRTFGIGFIGRLRHGISLLQVQHDVEQSASNFMREYADIYTGDVRVVPSVFPYTAYSTAKARPLLVLLAAAVVCILLIACANVANLLLARANARAREMALRSAVGAGRIRLLRQCLVESSLLAMAGAAAGLLLATAMVFGFRSFGPSDLPRLQDVTLDPVALIFTFTLALLTSVLFGLAPAWKLSHTAPQTCLKATKQVGTTHMNQRGQRIVAASEIALAMVLLIVGGILVRSFINLLDAPLGFDPHNTFVIRTIFDRNQYSNPAKYIALQNEIVDQLSHISGVEAVAEASDLPFSNTAQIGFSLEGPASNENRWVNYSLISPGYFRATGMILLKGRDFASHDLPDSPNVAVVNQAFAQKYFQGQDPLGHRILWDKPSGYTIIGVVNNVHIATLDVAPPPMIYFSIYQTAGETYKASFILRGKAVGLGLLPEIRKVMWSLDKELPIYGATTFRSLLSESFAQRRFTILLLSSFALIALTLAVIGVFGVISYLVTQRNREFGVRMALGADRSQIARMVVLRGVKVAMIGCISGIIMSIAASRVLLSSVTAIKLFDPIIFCLVSAIVFAAVLGATWLPANRAASIEPMEALRAE